MNIGVFTCVNIELTLIKQTGLEELRNCNRKLILCPPQK